MSAPLDIFKQRLDGTAHWVEGPEDLEAAKARARVLARDFPGQYIVVDNTTGEKSFIGTRLN